MTLRGGLTRPRVDFQSSMVCPCACVHLGEMPIVENYKNKRKETTEIMRTRMRESVLTNKSCRKRLQLVYCLHSSPATLQDSIKTIAFST